MACPHLSSSEFGGSDSSRGRQEGAEDRTSSNCRSSGPSYQKVSGLPEPWCGVYRSPQSPSHHHRFQESKSANWLLRRQCSEQWEIPSCSLPNLHSLSTTITTILHR
ncbi:hypothetical protein HYC85_003561 [Camellia sinensis]|uniref:Uncharacterized protein n=1 Tax=Camellia sinensis TaxID=4442 RepID=A0A7J7HW68_CAMSI|nr:hypothetical protein HYC85_003561 [Camellia sinensis]